MRIRAITFLTIALLLSSVVHAQNEAQAGEKKSLIIKTTAGPIFDLSKKKGKVVMVAFWASWCTICKVEMTHINDLYSKYNSSGLEIIGINVDGKLGWGKDLKYPIGMMDNYSAGDFGFPRSIPLVYLVGKDGVIAEKLASPDQIKVGNLENVIKTMLGKNNEAKQTPIRQPVETKVAIPQENAVPKIEDKKTKFNFKKN